MTSILPREVFTCKQAAVTKKMNTSTFVTVAVALIAVTVVFEVSEFSIALIGAGLYQLVRLLTGPVERPQKTQKPPKVTAKTETSPKDAHTRSRGKEGLQPRQHGGVRPTNRQLAAKQLQIDYRQVSVAPVTAPIFQSTGFHAEVQELLSQISPTTASNAVVKKIVRIVKQAIWPLIPEADVTGFASGNPTRTTAFAVAIPEIDIVVSVDPDVLLKRLEGRVSKAGSDALRRDPRKLQKSAIRACTDELTTAQGGLKFRRSAFRGEDPKVTLVAPSPLTGADISIPIDVSVNSATPLHAAALLTECGQLDSRAKDLILLVKRWARDRGIAHAAKGHLTPYAWSILTIYYMQVGDQKEGALLPPLTRFARSSGLVGQRQGVDTTPEQDKKEGDDVGTATVADLFEGFVCFYHGAFDWRNEAVSVRLGKRAPPQLSLPIHIVEGPEALMSPTIEDPFDAKRNLSTSMSEIGVKRLQEEFARAAGYFCGSCRSSLSLSELLEPWAPPHREDEDEIAA